MILKHILKHINTFYTYTNMSFTILRNQINESYDFIRPFTSNIIIRSISVMEEINDEENVFLLSQAILRLRRGDGSDVEVAEDYINRADGPSVALFREIIREAQIQENEPNQEEEPNPVEENPEAQPNNPNNAQSNNGRMISEFMAMFQ